MDAVIIHGGIKEFPNEVHQRLVLDCTEYGFWL